MPKQFGEILLFNPSTGQHSQKTHRRGYLKPFDNTFVLLKNKFGEPGM